MQSKMYLIALGLVALAHAAPVAGGTNSPRQQMFLSPRNLSMAKAGFGLALQRAIVHSQQQSQVDLNLGQESRTALRPIVGALLAGGLGVIGGAFVGGSSSGAQNCDEEMCGLEYLFWGAVVGETIMMPLGAHLGNGRRGSLGLDLLASIGVAGAGLGLTYATGFGNIFVLTAILQVVTTVAIEIKTGK